MKSLLKCLFIPAAVALLGLSGCQTLSSKKTAFDFDPPLTQPKNPAKVKLLLSTGAQRLYVVEGSTVLLATPVTVGKASSPTPHGNFTIFNKQERHRRASSPGAGYPMTYWMEFLPAYGLHWGFVKPFPATHGCVRLPMDSARKVFSVVRIGTPINISTSQPYDATIGKSLPTLDDSNLADPPTSFLNGPHAFDGDSQGHMWKYQ
ncbi:MAG: L,D-transpeptidase [Chthoniobacterales bacterium]